MSEYIRTNKFDTNECPNLFVKEKLIRTNVRIYIRDQYIRIFKYSNIFVTLCARAQFAGAQSAGAQFAAKNRSGPNLPGPNLPRTLFHGTYCPKWPFLSPKVLFLRLKLFFVAIVQIFCYHHDWALKRQCFRIYHNAGQATGGVKGPFFLAKIGPKLRFFKVHPFNPPFLVAAKVFENYKNMLPPGHCRK